MSLSARPGATAARPPGACAVLTPPRRHPHLQVPSQHRLYPATITVRPDASVFVRYFLEPRIIGDDPFTLDVVEPSVPATLGMLIGGLL